MPNNVGTCDMPNNVGNNIEVRAGHARARAAPPPSRPRLGTRPMQACKDTSLIKKTTPPYDLAVALCLGALCLGTNGNPRGQDFL